MLALLHIFDGRFGPDSNGTAAGAVGIFDTLPAHDNAGSREIRAFDVFHESFDGNIGIVNHGRKAIHHFRQVVGRNIRSHAYGNAIGTVHQKVGDTGRKHHRFLQGTVVVGHEVHGVLVNIPKHFQGDFGHTHFRITHSRRRVTIHGAEVAVAVYQGVAGREILGHADGRYIYRKIAMGMKFTEYIAHDTGRFLVRLIRKHAGFTHGIENAAVNRFQTIPHIRQRTGDDDGHGIVNVGIFHLPFQRGIDDFSFLPFNGIHRSSFDEA